MPTTSGRLLALLSLLQARRDWPGSLLAERLDVSPRTVRRDVDRLRELGYPIAAFKGPDGGYRLSAGTELPPLLLDDDQAVAITVALQVATSAGADLGEASLRALNTLRQVMPSRLRHRVDALPVSAVRPPAAVPVDAGVLSALGAAVHASEVLRFDYAGSSDGPPRRTEPHHVVTWGGRWYVVGWDLDRDDWRTYRVDRMALKTPNGPRFTPRELPGADLASFLVARFRGSSSTAWPCEGEVVLDLPAAEVTPYVAEGVVEALGPARTRVVLGAWSWVALAATFGRFDTSMEVVGPAELKDAFAVLSRRYTTA